MGIYLNPDNAEFKEAVESMIYVDKSRLISYTNSVLNTNRKNICVSRPRRFGKSMAVDMLVAYYSKGCDSRGLFAGREIMAEETFAAHLNRHNLIRLDIQRFVESKNDLDNFTGEIERAVIAELIKAFPECREIKPGGKLKTALDQIYLQIKKGFIFIVDEWDCVFRLAKDNESCQEKYLEFLRGLFKGAKYVDMAYMTGILPIKKYGNHSAINIFDEYSMTAPKSMKEYFGFTEGEVREQCTRHGVDYHGMAKWYDGYLLSGTHIYNPKSVADALTWKEFQSYWTGTETYEALKVYIERNLNGLKEAVVEMLGNGRCLIDPTTFQNDMATFKTRDDVLTLLVHLGYLTYDKKNGEAFIPNQEVAQEFLRAVKVGGWGSLMKSLERSEALLQSTWAMDGKAVAAGVAAAHQDTASIIRYHDENSLACTLYTAFYSTQAYYMKPIREFPTGRGFADVVYLPLRDVDRPALVVELKWNKSAAGAISQIKAKQYADWIKSYTGDILLVGINYDKKKGVHQCLIEKYVKE